MCIIDLGVYAVTGGEEMPVSDTISGASTAIVLAAEYYITGDDGSNAIETTHEKNLSGDNGFIMKVGAQLGEGLVTSLAKVEKVEIETPEASRHYWEDVDRGGLNFRMMEYFRILGDDHEKNLAGLSVKFWSDSRNEFPGWPAFAEKYSVPLPPWYPQGE